MDGNEDLRLRFANREVRRLTKTGVLRSSNLDFLVQANLADFVLFDDKISYELEQAPSMGSVRPLVARSMLVVEHDRVRERRGRFQSLRENGEKI
jgi:hypothetical protein